ncbi:MAG: M91 family zinc metallopeptidase [Bryobacteraceae bacterium]
MKTVLRLRWGLPPWEWRLAYGDAIEIKPDPNDPTFATRALTTLIRLDMTRTMHAAFDAIEASGHRVTVENYVPGPGESPYNATCRAHDIQGARNSQRGSDSTVRWNPDVHGFGPPGTTPDWQQPGSDVILGHELIHATHNATGTHGDNWQNDGVAVNEERNTVGLPQQVYRHPNDQTGYNGTVLPDTTGQPYTENQIRQEYRERGISSPVTGQPPDPRPSYYPNDPPVF